MCLFVSVDAFSIYGESITLPQSGLLSIQSLFGLPFARIKITATDTSQFIFVRELNPKPSGQKKRCIINLGYPASRTDFQIFVDKIINWLFSIFQHCTNGKDFFPLNIYLVHCAQAKQQQCRKRTSADQFKTKLSSSVIYANQFQFSSR